MMLRAAVIVVGVVGMVGGAWASGGEVKEPREGGFVTPCSLDGVNPVFHPEIFGNPAVARHYGFIQARNGAWQVAPGCHR